ncbi:MAG TPA: potassium transporter TrkG [Nannocystaceae bacterium]|nr:potassium transporter TrkG [Nannocystaceae bacterium]
MLRRALATGIGVMLVLVDLAWPGPITGAFAVLAMFALLAGLLVGLLRARRRRVLERVGALAGADAVVYAALLALFVARAYVLSRQSVGDAAELDGTAGTYDLVFLVVGALHGLSAAMPERLARLALRLAQRPALLLAGSFFAMILVGTVLLALPLSVEHVADVSLVDSLFTMTAAVCVTGMSVTDLGTSYTFFGEILILFAMQLGGIGIMTLAALALAFARDTALSTQLRYAAMLDARTLSDLRTTVRSIVFGTLAIETIGAVLLYLQFDGDPRIEGRSAAWLAAFHSISAFCNAGYALFPGNLIEFADDLGVQCILMALVVLGGLGFPVLRELAIQMRMRSVRLVAKRKPRPLPLSLMTRVVLWTTGILLVAGMVLVLALEYGRASMAGLDAGERVLAALFHSVNTRTSGFNSVDVGAFSSATLLWSCVLMFIGGSPGSTAGGIKTTTLATLVATMRGELRNGEPNLGRRSIAPEVFRRASAVTGISAFIVLVSLTLLTITEDHEFMPLLFETVAAFSTAGMTTGITPTLSSMGKLVITVTMFIGRVGPLTIALAVAAAEGKARYRLARESLPIG